MEKTRRIIFVAGNGVTREPMAKGIFLSLYPGNDLEVLARGLHVPFAEPLNPKAEAVMTGNGIVLDGFAAEQLRPEEITPDTLVFTMEERQRQTVLDKYETAVPENVFALAAYVGEELEIMDPYGGDLQMYGLCFESMKIILKKLAERMEGEVRV